MSEQVYIRVPLDYETFLELVELADEQADAQGAEIGYELVAAEIVRAAVRRANRDAA